MTELREKIADIKYRNDYSGRELKEFIDLPVYLQNIYLAEADQIIEVLVDMDCGIWTEKELPENPYFRATYGASVGREVGYNEAQKDMIRYISECFTPIGTK